jgi:hypothetical protein
MWHWLVTRASRPVQAMSYHKKRTLEFVFIFRMGRRPMSQHTHYFFPFCVSFAYVSFNDTARLNTSFPPPESLSTEKYPSRSN